MSVLNPPTQPAVPAGQVVAERLKQQTRQTFQQLVMAFNNGARSFWNNNDATPADIAAALGTDAKEVFELHGKIGALLASVNPAAIAPGVSAVGAFTYNADGTVTVTGPAPEPAPEPAPTPEA
jgi:hypothetical protein